MPPRLVRYASPEEPPRKRRYVRKVVTQGGGDLEEMTEDQAFGGVGSLTYNKHDKTGQNLEEMHKKRKLEQQPEAGERPASHMHATVGLGDEQEEILATVRDHITDLGMCGNAALTLLCNAIDAVNQIQLQWALNRSKAVIAYATDKFYAYPYKDVPSYWRSLYYDASLVQCVALHRLGRYETMIEVVDMALIMTGGHGKDMQKVLKWIEATIPRKTFDEKSEFPVVVPKLSLTHPIPRTEAPSLQWFQKHIRQVHSPVIITAALTHWNALNDWTSPQYFFSKTLNGKRLVPIEIGESYVSANWTQKIVSFESFLHDHLLRDATPKGYLAQHNLFAQVPELRADISIPEYCFAIPPRKPPDNPLVPFIDTEGSVQENIWMGPAGTKSPLHNDPYENIYAQVIGYKYFRLFPPCETGRLYPRGVEGGIEMGNTSLVDVDDPDLQAFPAFGEAEYVEGILGPGECLYIPRGWWHFVRSETVSIGVSFWW